jgi:electron transfer DM13
MTLIRAHPRVAGLAIAALALAAAVPVTAYLIVPQLVRSTLVEDLPTAAPTAAATDRRAGTIATPAIETLLSGQLVRITAADYGSGTIRIVRVGTDRFLRFDDVDIAGAPDMYVYLSERSDGKPGTFTDLGKLKATNGSFNYPIPSEVDLASVRSVVVWCRQFNVTVTYAALRSG